MIEALANDEQEIADFFDFIFGPETGYLYIALKSAENQQKWSQHFFEWPTQKAAAVQLALDSRSNYEVYYGPALFSEKSATKEAVKGSRVIWCEIDGTLPDLGEIPEPSMRIRSSNPGHEHFYWRTDKMLQVPELERFNRSITYLLGADTSGWDACQVLRPPATYNHKRSKEVIRIHQDELFVDTELFKGLPEPPPQIEAPLPDNLPQVEDAVARIKWKPKAWVLFKQGVKQGSRSEGLMALGYYLAEYQTTTEDMLAVLLNADMRWGKFHGRNDQLKRLMEIVTRSKAKFPVVNSVGDENTEFQGLGFNSFVKSDINVEWVWEGFLQKSGYMLLTGPSGVGKTTLAMDAAAKFALGYNFLDEPCSSMRIGVLSLEMGHPDLKVFVEKQAETYNDSELAVLEENLKIYPIGEPLYLNEEREQARIIKLIEKEKLDGLIIDSFSSATSGDLSQETSVKPLLDWNDHIRKEYGIFTWFIHHHRKATGDNKRPNKLSDVYGYMGITARATTVFCLWESGVKSSRQLIPLKIRLREQPDPFIIFRDGHLQFTKKQMGITIVEETEAAVTHEQETVVEEKSDLSPGEGHSAI